MVIISMCPTWRIDLSCRDTHSPQGRHRECRLLSTTTISRLQRSQRTTRSCITRTIGHMLVAPVVHLEDSVLDAQILHPRLQCLIEHLTTVVEALIIHSNRHYKMPELPFWHRLSPRHLCLCLKRKCHVLLIERTWIIRLVRQWHILVEEIYIVILRLRNCSMP